MCFSGYFITYGLMIHSNLNDLIKCFRMQMIHSNLNDLIKCFRMQFLCLANYDNLSVVFWRHNLGCIIAGLDIERSISLSITLCHSGFLLRIYLERKLEIWLFLPFVDSPMYVSTNF